MSEYNATLRTRLRNNQCAVLDCASSFEECKIHEDINLTLYKELRVDFKNSRQGRFSRTPRGSAAQRRYIENHPEKVKENNAKEKQKEARKIYLHSPEGKAALQRYNESEKGKAVKRRYRNSDKGKEAKRRELDLRKQDRLVAKVKSRVLRNLCGFCEKILTECKEHETLNSSIQLVFQGGD